MNHDIMKAPTRQEALQALLAVWHYEPQIEYLPLADCLDRVTAEALYAVNTLPMVPISAMDGYAVKAAAFADGTPDVTKWIPGEDFTPADTGDAVPQGYDAVIPVEQLHFNAEGLLTLEADFAYKNGSGIRPAGCMMQAGDLLVPAHTRITPDLRANLAIGGITMIPVIRKPVVAFIPTGSELTPAGLAPRPGENVESNSLMLSDYLRRWGAEPVCYTIVRDDPEKLEQTLNEALRFADLVLINGGSSKGTEDFNSLMLERRGSFFLHTVRTVPGRPVGIACIDGKAVINMPGPVLAAWTVADWLVYPMICTWFGIPTEKRKTVTAFLTEDLRKGPPVEVYSRVRLENREGIYYATPLGRESRNSAALRDGIGLLIGPIGSFGWTKGQPVTVELLAAEERIPKNQESPMIEIPENCSQCGRHCPTAALSCGRGKAYLERLKTGQLFHSGHAAADLLVECADTLRHNNTMRLVHGGEAAELLGGLTEEEQQQLITLLKKQQTAWNLEHEKRHAGGQGPHRPHTIS